MFICIFAVGFLLIVYIFVKYIFVFEIVYHVKLFSTNVPINKVKGNGVERLRLFVLGRRSIPSIWTYIIL